MHIEPTQHARASFFGNPPEGPVVMLNLLRFRDTADYSAHPDLAPAEPISGAAAYDLYTAGALPILTEAGGRALFDGAALPYLIGPTEEVWDRMILVRHRSAADFRSFAEDSGYLEIVGHRTAALLDSRLMPVISRP